METWYRGESTKASPAQAGGFLHDLGDGVYFTNDLGVAQVYARKRVQESGGEQQIFRIEFEGGRPGNVLDLRDKRWGWDEFAKPIESHIRTSNENYGRSFANYLKVRGIDINQYDAVIGPEYLNGGIQLCILHKNGQPSPLARAARAMMQPLSGKLSNTEIAFRQQKIETVRLRQWWQSRNATRPRAAVPIPYAQEFYQRQGAAQNAAALFGTMLASALHRANGWSINAQVQKQLETTYKDRVESSFASGQGVLVIINIQEPALEDVNGFRSQVLRSIVLRPGPSAEATLRQWNSADSWGIGADRNCRITEQYLWLDPHR